jgi:hypothetical protein
VYHPPVALHVTYGVPHPDLLDVQRHFFMHAARLTTARAGALKNPVGQFLFSAIFLYDNHTAL